MQLEAAKRTKKRSKLVLDNARLREFAMNYAARYATNSVRLTRYLKRKIREAEWVDPVPPQLDPLLEQMVDRKYVDDQAFAQMKSISLARRGMGSRRISQELRAEGTNKEAIAELVADLDPFEAARIFARRKRLGPFAKTPLTPEDRRKHLAAFARAGHDFSVACAILDSNVENLQDI